MAQLDFLLQIQTLCQQKTADARRAIRRGDLRAAEFAQGGIMALEELQRSIEFGEAVLLRTSAAESENRTLTLQSRVPQLRVRDYRHLIARTQPKVKGVVV